MKLTVIIINYKTPDLTADCLHTLAVEQTTVPGLRVILVDNASNDGSVPILEALIQHQNWSAWITLLPLPVNLGFAGGNNVGMGYALTQTPQPDLVLLLNSDTLVHAGCLARVRARMAQDASIGVLSCHVLNADGTVQNVCRRMPRPDRETLRALGLAYALPRLFGWADLEDDDWDRRTTARDVEWVGGAFMCIRTQVIHQLGGLDAGFFFYGEDMEFCHRVRRAGWRVFFDPAGTITHLGGASSDTTRLADRRRNVLRWQARFLVQRKCYGPLAERVMIQVYRLGFLMRYCWSRIRRGRQDEHTLEMGAMLEDMRAARAAM